MLARANRITGNSSANNRSTIHRRCTDRHPRLRVMRGLGRAHPQGASPPASPDVAFFPILRRPTPWSASQKPRVIHSESHVFRQASVRRGHEKWAVLEVLDPCCNRRCRFGCASAATVRCWDSLEYVTNRLGRALQRGRWPGAWSEFLARQGGERIEMVCAINRAGAKSRSLNEEGGNAGKEHNTENRG